MQFDVVNFRSSTMDVWTPSPKDVFTTKLNCDADDYDSDDDIPMDQKMAVQDDTGSVESIPEEEQEEEQEMVEQQSASSKKVKFFTKDEVFLKARKCCHIFHLYSGLLPPKLAMNIYKASGSDQFVNIMETRGNISRFQHYTPTLRSVHE